MNIKIIFLLLSNSNNLAGQRTINNLFREHNLTILPQFCHLKRASGINNIIYFKKCRIQSEWYMSVTTEVERLRQGDFQIEAREAT